MSTYEIFPLSTRLGRYSECDLHPLCDKLVAEMKTSGGPALAMFCFYLEEPNSPMFDNPFETDLPTFNMPYLLAQDGETLRPLLKSEIAKTPSLAEAVLDQVDFKDAFTVTNPCRIESVFSDVFSNNAPLFLTLLVTPNVIMMFEDPDKVDIDHVRMALPKPNDETAHQALQRLPAVQEEFKSILNFFEATWPSETGKLTRERFKRFCDAQ